VHPPPHQADRAVAKATSVVLFRFSTACDTSTLWMRASGRISDDARAFLGEKLGGSLAGPARGAGDNRDLIPASRHSRVPSGWPDCNPRLWFCGVGPDCSTT